MEPGKARTSPRGMLVGAAVALGLPIAAIVLAALVERGIVPPDPVHDAFGVLGAVLWAALGVFGPLGIVIFGWSAGARSPASWLGTAVLGILVVGPIWLAGAVALGGATGNPF